MRQLSRQSQRPWLCMGDFNEILGKQEKQGVNLQAPWQISTFRECLSDCNLYDLGCRGSLYTWCNSREALRTVRERLDHALSNEAWSSMFPFADVSHIHEACTDHSALLQTTDKDLTRSNNSKQHRFRFEVAWLRSEDCKGVIQRAWASTESVDPTDSGSTDSLLHKLSSCHLHLTNWDKSGFGNISKRIKEVEGILKGAACKEITSSSKSRTERLKAELEELLEREETVWKQSSKALWLKEGDQNSSCCKEIKKAEN
ncbi:UNVERIFIED_CONTAM: hypothetical protein Slati_0808200 [Sesamum latifolium]|uniref:Endonuclease/exonuclease/phosphatase n=1 Tax=Sesamum latifolium TaxID=2727402 RepID=A0AAW2XL17_9LAMI